jgi:hypothetical protein
MEFDTKCTNNLLCVGETLKPNHNTTWQNSIQ